MGRRVQGDCPLPTIRLRIVVWWLAWFAAGHAMAGPAADLDAVARQTFDSLPELVLVEDVVARCRGDAGTSLLVRYCSSEDRIYLDKDISADARSAYLLAHVMGHAIQVKHGVADVALAMIRANRPREAELRGMVTRQVECIAGVLLGRAGMPLPDLEALFGAEPFTGSHWGRTPMFSGPKVSIGLAARQTWLARGFNAGAFQACASGEMGDELLLKAEKP